MPGLLEFWISGLLLFTRGKVEVGAASHDREMLRDHFNLISVPGLIKVSAAQGTGVPPSALDRNLA
jgi:uncharacterized membrane protein YbjE (DUF340 family)